HEVSVTSLASASLAPATFVHLNVGVRWLDAVSFIERLHESQRQLEVAQTARAWALATGLLAVVVAAWTNINVFPHVTSIWPRAEAFLSVGFVAAVNAGTLGLLYIGLRAEPSDLGNTIAYICLWLGNIALSVAVAGFPLALFLGLLFVFGALPWIRRRSYWQAAVFAACPFVALAGSVALRLLGFI
ncbi:MAG: hypothetical protein AAFR91_13370, partial [Pseudomonadota bacterium]